MNNMKKKEVSENIKQLGNEQIKVILSSYLFQGVSPDELRAMLPCLDAQTRSYSKDEMIFRYGDNISRIGLVLSGNAAIYRDDYWGNRHIMTAVMPGELFGEAYAVLAGAAMEVNVQACADTQILFLEVGKVVHLCSNACSFHNKMINNLLVLFAKRNVALNAKLTHITQHSLRDKILSYLSSVEAKEGSGYFDIPFDRQQLADYLDADRSALSGELSRMKRDGLIDYHKNHFRLNHEGDPARS